MTSKLNEKSVLFKVGNMEVFFVEDDGFHYLYEVRRPGNNIYRHCRVSPSVWIDNGNSVHKPHVAEVLEKGYQDWISRLCIDDLLEEKV